MYLGDRYKKTTRSKMQKEKREQQKKLTRKYEKNKKSNDKEEKLVVNNNAELKTTRPTRKSTKSKELERKKNKARRRRREIFKRVSISLLLIFVLAIIYYVCKVGITNIPEQIQNVFKPEEKKVQNLTEVKIGLNKIGNEYPLLSKSIHLKELNNHIYPPLLKIDEKYNITYNLLDKIEKINNKEYLLYVKADTLVDSLDIKATLDNYIKAGEKTIYNLNVKNIEGIEVNDNIVKIKLKEDDPYYIYNLNIPIISRGYLVDGINSLSNKKGYMYDIQSNNANELIYNRTDMSYNDYPSKVTINKFNSLEEMVENFKNGTIDMFFTSNSNVIKLLGKQEYSLKTYNNGETIFLLGNKGSDIFNNIEIRKALAYSINREDIIKNILEGQGKEIDLPYVYDEVKYRYDKTAGENVLLNGGFKKSSGLYGKYINNKYVSAVMTLIVNENDEALCKIADSIKSDVEDIGIRINIEKLSETKLQKRLNNGEFDLVLANINLNENPNLSFMYNYININDNINNKIEEINNSIPEELKNKVQQLRDVISEEAAVIGIAARTTDMIYNKAYTKIENIWYNATFNKLEIFNKTK